MRTIKGLTAKQWLRLLGLPALIAVESALILALSGDGANTFAFMVVVFVFSVCVAVYVTSAVNAYHEWRGDRMSYEEMETRLKQLERRFDYYRGNISKTRNDINEVWYELEKTRMDLRRMARDKE